MERQGQIDTQRKTGRKGRGFKRNLTKKEKQRRRGRSKVVTMKKKTETDTGIQKDTERWIVKGKRFR